MYRLPRRHKAGKTSGPILPRKSLKVRKSLFSFSIIQYYFIIYRNPFSLYYLHFFRVCRLTFKMKLCIMFVSWLSRCSSVTKHSLLVGEMSSSQLWGFPVSVILFDAHKGCEVQAGQDYYLVLMEKLRNSGVRWQPHHPTETQWKTTP